MIALVAGGSGLIGQAVCRHLFPAAINYDPVADPATANNLTDRDFEAFIDCGRYDHQCDQVVTWETVIGQFKLNGGGRMILFSSIYGHKAPDFNMYPGTEIPPTPMKYAMDKAAVEQATRYLAQKLKPWGIQVNAIAPGGVCDKHSEEFQQAYIASGGVSMIQTKNILPVVDMLLHPDNQVNGQVIEVSGGWRL
jgi:NAD(P)-dependent dehydrogenase (short-subunit alcohol dehydrogenase family)